MTLSEASLRALAQGLESGLSPQLLGAQSPALLSPALSLSLRQASATGTPLGEVLRVRGVVDEGAAALLSAGERAGFLPAALRVLADDLARARAQRRRTLMAAAYPLTLLLLASVVLPLPVWVRSGLGAYAATAGPGVLAVMATVLGVFVIAPRLSPATQAAWRSRLARVPIVSRSVVDLAQARAFDVLGATLKAGLPVTLSVPLAVRAAGLASWQAALPRAMASLSSSLAAALAELDIASAGATLSRVQLAEQTGTLDTALPQLASEARDRARRRQLLLASLVGVVFFLVVAAAIGVAVVGGAQTYIDTIDQAGQE